jgi:CelD/BcsL family acetyltransferase involved in cellulose biosynthesis
MKRWNSVNQPGSFGSPERKVFYSQMAESFLRKGWLELWFLELNGAAAAAQFCFRYGDTVHGLQEGFDPQFAQDKVGYALRAAMLRHFIETGARKYDFLGGLAPHKQKWGAEQGTYLNLSFARPRSLGRCYLSCSNFAGQSKSWLKKNLPSSAWNGLHRLKLSRKQTRSSICETA